MKNCSYCGKEYADDVVRCAVDDTLLPVVGLPPSPVLEAAEISPSPSLVVEAIDYPPSVFWTDRRLRIFELVIVCLIAFGSSIGLSIYSFFNSSYGGDAAGSAVYRWMNAFLHEASALALLWFVLARRGKPFSSLGLNLKLSDFGWAILLAIGGSVLFSSTYGAIYSTGLTTASHQTSLHKTEQYLFSGGVSYVTFAFLFVNPFFEELIVRAYLMTEIKKLAGKASTAIIVSTLLQTSYHLYQGVPLAIADGACFLIFSIFYAKTNRIAPVILAHLCFDVGATLSYLVRQ